MRVRLRSFPRLPPLLVTVLTGLLLAWGTVALLEARLQPVAAAAARAQVRNAVVRAVEEAVARDLEQRPEGYRDLVDIQRDGTGAITALSADMGQMNLLRSHLVENLLEVLDGISVSQVRIPLGALLDSDFLWGMGPSFCARALSVGTVSAELDSRFTSAGVNQTLHRVWLEVKVPITVLLPGGPVEADVETELCVAETVIVGQVPDAVLGGYGG